MPELLAQLVPMQAQWCRHSGWPVWGDDEYRLVLTMPDGSLLVYEASGHLLSC